LKGGADAGFVSPARRRAIAGEFPSSGAPNKHFVAIARETLAIATFLPYSQHFAAIPGHASTIATKYCLDAAPLTFAGATIDARGDHTG
jgi:hypothetical protein